MKTPTFNINKGESRDNVNGAQKKERFLVSLEWAPLRELVPSWFKGFSFSVALSLLSGLLLTAIVPKTAAGETSEYTVKAAYLFNFTRFVEWPKSAFAGAASPIVVGVLGDDPFGGSLDEAVSGKSAAGHPIEVKRLGGFSASTSGAMRKCQILFISYSEKGKVAEILAALKGSSTLTVSEIEKFPLKGGIVLFDQEGQKITLVVNPKPAEKAGLTLSSKLMQVAKVYNQE